MTRSSGARAVGLGIAVLGLAATTEARAEAPSAQAQVVLAKLADQHGASPVLRKRKWDAATVARLKAWVGARAPREMDARTSDDVALLRDELARPVSVSVSGAVSLGSYQGGYLYYYLRALAEEHKLAPRVGAKVAAGSPLGLVTGASSGSITAVIAAIASCQEPVLEPRQSLFFRTWFPVSAEELNPVRAARLYEKKKLDKKVVTYPGGLLSLTPIDDAVKRVEDAWNGGAWSAEPCDVDVGLSTTRMRQRLVEPLGELSLPKQSEKIMFRLHGPGRGKIPGLANFVVEAGDPDVPLHDDRLPLLEKVFRRLGPDPTIGDVTGLLRASSAFSFAFPPHRLTLWSTALDHDAPTDYTDGGVFDNRPVGLAVEMQRWRLGLRGESESKTRYLVADPDIESWRREGAVPPPPPPGPGAPAPTPETTPFLETWLPFLGDFITTAFEVQVMDALERERTMFEGLELLPRRSPVAGAYLMEFLAFAEEDFRLFDFYMGMVDAWEQLSRTSLGFQVLEAIGETPTFEDAPELQCLLAWRTATLAGTAEPAPDACAALDVHPDHPELRRNIEALARASARTREWDVENPPSAKGREQAMFLAALGAGPRPYVYRQLEYHDAPATAATVDLAIRENLQDIIEHTTEEQPFGADSLAVGSLGKALANYYVYSPPTRYAGAGLVSDRGFELLGAWRPWKPRAPHWIDVRPDLALRVIGIHLAAYDAQPGTGRTAAFTYMAAAHLTGELQLQNICPGLATLQSTVQFHLGLGWAGESLQTWNGPLLWRQGPEILVGAAAFQRFYLDVVFDQFLDDCASNNRCSHADPYLSPSVPPIVDADWGLRFSLGYRFFLD
ncbi:MAG TPA: patatin-like phospholipase family protein [Polyangia bacterium]|nr:patatin-like phospholipase family protein [Polyangia bacterium]